MKKLLMILFVVLFSNASEIDNKINSFKKECEKEVVDSCSYYIDYKRLYTNNLEKSDFDLAKRACMKNADKTCISLFNLEKNNKSMNYKEIFKKACKTGDIEKCYFYAKINIDENTKDILKRNCDKNHAKSCELLAWKYDLDHDDTNRFDNLEKYLKKSCYLGNMSACLFLLNGSKYEFLINRGEIYNLLCENGDINSCKELNIKPNKDIYKKALRHYEDLALNSESSYAYFELAKIFELGLVGKKDLKLARNLYEKSCSYYNNLSCFKVAMIDERNDINKAFNHHKKLCESANAYSCERLGKMYKKGIFVKADDEKSRHYYGLAMGLYDFFDIEAYNRLEKEGYEPIY